MTIESQNFGAAAVRETLAEYLQENWSGKWPVLWQNMPVQPPLPEKGWLRFAISIDRIAGIGLGRSRAMLRGSIRITLAISKGEGMSIMDAAIDQMIALFSGKDIGGIRLGTVRMGQGQNENGFYINTMTIGFSMIQNDT